ncbi:MAG: hypothetical protein IT430_00800 [Phycisphaerales bacterium]|nr:hypothetical protein [Phycisphaerales bacterium]
MNVLADPPAPTCIVCGYDLRAQPPQGKCPECGTDVERSLHGFWLRYSDQRWVSSMARGAGWTSTGLTILLAAIAVEVLVFAGTMVMNVRGQSATPAVVSNWLVVLGLLFIASVVAIVVSGAVFAVGLWWLTEPEPRARSTKPVRPIALRSLTVALVPATLFVLANATRFGNLTMGVPAWVTLPVQAAMPTIIGLQAWLLLAHLRALEQRCIGFDEDRDRLLRKYRRNVLGVTISMLVFSVLGSMMLGRLVGIGLVIIIIAWIAAASQITETHKRIRFELAVSPGTEHGGQPP